jgi:hypothetical protein
MADPIQGANPAEAPTSRFDYRYPLTKLSSSDDYLKITVLEYKAPGFAPDGSFGNFGLPTAGEISGYGKASEKGTIILPIPDTVQDSNNASWGESTLGPLQALAAAAGQSVITDPKNIGTNIRSAVSNLLSASKTGTAQKAMQGTAIQLGLNVLLNDKSASNLVSRYSGAVFNSNIELIFSGVTLRSPFSFGFDIVPRSKKEAETVKEIIRKLKLHSAAKKSAGAATGLFLKAPEVFKLEYMSGGRPHPYLHKFKICALKSMSVNYTGSGTYATYSDATPVHMILGLNFQELTPVYSEDYDQVGGVGY